MTTWISMYYCEKRLLQAITIAAMLLVGSLNLFAAVGDERKLSQSAQDEIADLMKEKASWTPAQCKLDSHLIHAIKLKQGKAFAPKATHLRVDVKEQADGRVLVDITAMVTPEVLALVKLSGGEVINNFPRFNAIRALVPLTKLETLAASPDVKMIQRAAEGFCTTGSVNSQGDTTHQAAFARNKFGVTGAGVKVGVLSDSVTYAGSSQGYGDLGTVTVLSGQGGSGAGEGTAMLEIIHDLAPDAALYFATTTQSPASFAQNILDLRTAGCDIIVDDFTSSYESPFQDGVVAQAINAVTTNGALYFSAAGNWGNLDSGRASTWEGDFADGGAATSPISESGRLHSFGSATYNTALPTYGALQSVWLYWSDPLGASTNDYDVFVLNPSGTSVVASSTTRQSGTQDPYEYVSTLTNGERIVIVKYSGNARYLHLGTYYGRLSTSTTGATYGHAAARNAITVGAVDAATAYPGAFTNNAGIAVEKFNADGPRRIFFNPDGSAITPGNFSSTGGLLLQKPDITAADDVATTVPNFHPFIGSSAAAPHAAAIAALLKSYNTNLSAAQIRAILTSTALDIGTPGWDRDSGYGIVMADAALQAATPNGLFILPGNSMTASGTMGGPFNPSSPSFSLTNNGGAAFSWTLGNTSLWLNASPTSGTLIPGGVATTVTVDLNSASSNLVAGAYSTSLIFSNLTSGIGQSRQFNLSVSSAPSGAYVSSNLVLQPVGYWRLNETNQPASLLTVSNSGLVGLAGTGSCVGLVSAGEAGLSPRSSVASYRFYNPAMTTNYLGSYVDVPFNTNLNPNGAFSIEFWANHSSLSNQWFCPVTSVFGVGGHLAGWMFLDDYTSSGANQSYCYRTWAWRVGTTGGTNVTVQSATVNQAVGWDYIVGVYDGSTITLYINGSVAAGPTVVNGFSPNTNAPLRFGGSSLSTNSGTAYFGRGFDGWLDEIAFYTNALSATAVNDHWLSGYLERTNCGAHIMSNNPAGYWHLDEFSPHASLPVAINSGSLAPVGNGIYTTGSLPGVPGVTNAGFGSANFACQFNGAGHVEISAADLNITGPLTLSAWTKASPANGSQQSIAGKGTAFANPIRTSYRLTMDGTGHPRFSDGAQPSGEIVGPSRIDDNQWHHLVGVHDGAGLEALYVDGQLVVSVNNATSPVVGNDSDFWIGADPDSASAFAIFQIPAQPFNGTIDEAAIWTNALSGSQIQQLYFTATNSVIQTAPVFQPLTRSGNTLFLNWSAISNRTYQVQYKTNLTQSSWGILTTLTATNATVSFPDDMTTDRQRFYRVVLMP